MEKDKQYSATIKRVGINTIVWNVILSAAKFVAGVLGRSTAMISDAVHSASDVVSTVIVMVGAKMAGKQSDEKHSYGHERFESIASIFLGVILAITAVGIGYSGLKEIIAFKPGTYQADPLIYLALGGAVLSIVGKGIMYWYTIAAANRINSTSLKADAWHHLSDSLSSIGSLLGIVGLMVGKGWEILDPIAGIIICLVILKVVYDIVKNSIDQLVDKSIPQEQECAMHQIITATPGVISIKKFKSRIFGNKMYVDAEVYVDRELSLLEADQIVQAIHESLEGKYTDIKHAFICARPDNLAQMEIKE